MSVRGASKLLPYLERKGTTIPNSLIAEIMGAVADDSERFALTKLQLKGMVERYLHSQDLVWTVKILPEGVRILTDREALAHNRKLHAWGRRKIRRAARQLDGIDTVQLDEHERSVHATEQQRLTNTLSALDAARRLFRSPWEILVDSKHG